MKFFFFLTVLLSVINCFAQYNITGYVVDSDGEVIEFATVCLLSDSLLIGGGVSDSIGYFGLEVENGGEYWLSISYVGYEEFKQKINCKEEGEHKVGKITLVSDGLLKEVVVKGKRRSIIKKIDRLVFNVETNILLAGGNTWDALSKAPGVRTDFKGNVFVNGKTSSIYIDGRKLQMSPDEVRDYLQAITSDNVHSLEVIANPSSKYDAEDITVVNIILQEKKKAGLNGNIRGHYQHTSVGSQGIGGNLNYNNRKVNVFGNYSYNRQKTRPLQEEEITYSSSTWKLFHDKTVLKNSHFLRLGLDYNFKPSHVIGVQGDWYFRQSDNITSVRAPIFGKEGTKIDSTLNTENSNYGNVDQYFYNINYQADLDTLGRSLNIDVDYGRYNNNQNQWLESVMLNGQDDTLSLPSLSRIASSQGIWIFTSKIAYSHRIKKMLLDVGGKLSRIETDNTLAFDNNVGMEFVNDSLKSNSFLYSEDNYAFYCSLAGSLTKKLDYKIGVRSEYTRIEGYSLSIDELNKNKYLNLFPNLFLLYKLSDDHVLDFTFSSRIKRPEYWRLNPFTYYTTPSTSIEGNPFLNPSYSYNFQTSYVLNQRYIFALDMAITKDIFTQISEQDNTKETLVFRQRNLSNSNYASVIALIPIDVFNWWTINTFSQAGYQVERSDYLNSEYNFKKFKGYFSVSNSFVISDKHNIMAELSGWYSIPGYQGILDLGTTYDVSAGIRKHFSNNKGSISLTFSDLFLSNSNWINVDYLNQKYRFLDQQDSRFVRLSISYKILGSELVSNRKREVGNKEEQERIE